MRSRESLRAVLNSSPLIALAKLGLLEKAISIFSEVEVPLGVLDEVEKKKDEAYAEIVKLIEKGRIRVENVRRKLPRLGLGESSAILLALMKEKILVLDDRKARRLAKDLGLEVIGTISVLKKLYEERILEETTDTLYNRLVEIGFYIDKKIFDKVFEEEQ